MELDKHFKENTLELVDFTLIIPGISDLKKINFFESFKDIKKSNFHHTYAFGNNKSYIFKDNTHSLSPQYFTNAYFFMCTNTDNNPNLLSTYKVKSDWSPSDLSRVSLKDRLGIERDLPDFFLKKVKSDKNFLKRQGITSIDVTGTCQITADDNLSIMAAENNAYVDNDIVKFVSLQIRAENKWKNLDSLEKKNV